MKTSDFKLPTFSSKEIDWRYKTYSSLHIENVQARKIIWPGRIDITNVTEDIFLYPISFLDAYSGLVQDSYYQREVDGKTGHLKEVKYNLTSILSVLRIIKKAWEMDFTEKTCYLFSLFEEEVDKYGIHTVSLLGIKNEDSSALNPVYGIHSSDEYRYFDLTQWESVLKCHTDIESIQLLHNSAYRWLK
jgi:hypothetical protein